MFSLPDVIAYQRIIDFNGVDIGQIEMLVEHPERMAAPTANIQYGGIDGPIAEKSKSLEHRALVSARAAATCPY
ncbi:hypothetical protein V2P20_02240 [Methylobacter sp. Wu1]|uniref:hypothetical protein n=1 Tax=Methylobacter sp. Wu1 TaxID=3119359 RepID=UPI002F921F7A